MVDCLLISPPPTFDREKKFTPRAPPVKSLSVASYLEETGVECEVMDAVLDFLSKEEILQKIKNIDPEVIGIAPFDAPTPDRISLGMVRDLSEAIKKELDGDRKLGFLWSFGESYLREIMRKCDCLDFAVFGDPEPVMHELSKTSIEDVEGVLFREGGNIKSNGMKLLDSLDEIPPLHWEKIPFHRYKATPHVRKTDSHFFMEVGRGCPYDCKFCAHQFFPYEWRAKSPERVVDDVERLKRKYGAKEVEFLAQNFGFDHDWLRSFCMEMIDRDLDIIWSCETRIGTIPKKLIRLMKKSGCRNILCGIESGDGKILRTVEKGTDLERIEESLEFARKLGIETVGSFILGLPDETPRKSRKTIEFAKSLDLDYAQFFLCRVYRNEDFFKNFGEIKTVQVSEYGVTGKVFLPDGYGGIDELKSMKKRAYTEFYLRKDYILKKLIKSGISDIERYLTGGKILLKNLLN